MGAIIAGWAAGYIMGIATTVLVVYALTRGTGFLIIDRYIDPDVSRPLLAVPVFVGASLAWTVVGVVLGALYQLGDFADMRGAVGIPSLPFAFAMLVVGLLPVGILSAVWWRLWWVWVALALVFALSFGWAMPVLAGQW